MRWSTWSASAFLVLGFPTLASADYGHTKNFGDNDAFFVTGTIATSCDNSCSLNSSNITMWSLTNSDDGYPTTASSTDPMRTFSAIPGDDLIATSQGIYFNFPDTGASEIDFSSVNGQQQLMTAGAYGGPGYYTVCPSSSICVLGALGALRTLMMAASSRQSGSCYAIFIS